MWIDLKTVPNLMAAEMWKELFEAEGVPTRILPEVIGSKDNPRYRILVPELKKHVIDEILRKV